jgi:hypothetical protein
MGRHQAMQQYGMDLALYLPYLIYEKPKVQLYAAGT